MKKRICVLVVDDSAFMRKMLTGMIESDPECEVVKTAGDGVEALKAVADHKPDVITLDIELPEIDGLAVLAYIMEDFPTPVVMVTGFSEFLGDETIKALEYGAVGFVRKPKGSVRQNIEMIRRDLISQIKVASRVDVNKLVPSSTARKGCPEPQAKNICKATDGIVAVAASSGGPRALSQVIPNLPAGLQAGVLVLQHMPHDFIPSFAKRLNWESALQVKVAEDLEPIQQGKVLVIPSNLHSIVEPGGDGAVVRLVRPLAPEEGNRFVIADEVMCSLAPIYGKNATGVILTGMGSDGTAGLRAIKAHGGTTMAEDESTAVIYGMPRSAIEAGVADKAVPLQGIADAVVEAVSGQYSSVRGV